MKKKKKKSWRLNYFKTIYIVNITSGYQAAVLVKVLQRKRTIRRYIYTHTGYIFVGYIYYVELPGLVRW